MEGFLRSSAVFDRLMSSIELNVLSVLLMPGEEDAHDVLEFGFTSIEAKYMVFLSCLEKKVYFDGLHSSSIVKCQECIRFVEVFWQGSTHRVYFKKPKILEDVSGDYLSKFDEIDGASQEDKLGGFLAMVKALHIEAKHQQLLKHYGLSYMWSRRYYLSWLMFVIGVVINVMLLKYYNRSKEDHTIHIGFEYDE